MITYKLVRLSVFFYRKFKPLYEMEPYLVLDIIDI